MKGRKILEYMGDMDAQFVEEAGAADNISPKKEKSYKRAMIPAACTVLALLLCTGGVLAKTWGENILNIFSSKEESGYDLEFQVKRISNDVFTGKVEEVHDIIVQQYKDYNPVMSWYPGACSVSFSTVEEAIEYLGVDFFENPIKEKPESVTLNINGVESGEFSTVCLMADYSIDGFSVQVWNEVFTDISGGEASSVGVSVLDGSFFDTGEKSFFETEETEDSIIYSGRAAEYLEYDAENAKTGSGEDAVLLSAGSAENNYVTQEGHFVMNDVLYMINVAAEEKEKEEAKEVLKSLLEKY